MQTKSRWGGVIGGRQDQCSADVSQSQPCSSPNTSTSPSVAPQRPHALFCAHPRNNLVLCYGVPQADQVVLLKHQQGVLAKIFLGSVCT